ncbi:MAG: Xaa-Pro peptidase family protein [Sulfolobales archaeon]
MPADNLNKLIKLLEFKGLNSVLICGQPNITYFLGLPKPSGCLLIVEIGGNAELLTPLLDYDRVLKYVGSRTVEVKPYTPYGIGSLYEVVSDPLTYVRDKLSTSPRVGVDLNYINYMTYRLVSALGERVVNISDDLLSIRAVKEDVEVGFISRALKVTEDALLKVLDDLSVGSTELEVVGLLEKYLRDLGAEGVAFDTIVASGFNSAYPHAIPSSRKIVAGEPIVIDVGAVFHTYASDLTRTVCVGSMPSEVSKILEAVDEALSVAEDFVGPYVRASEVDCRVRKVLSKYGLDKYFIHSTGHGVGVEVHEAPRIAQGVEEELKPGMVITLEPGTYIRDHYGVRLEDMVLITKSGRKVLNTLSHKL